MSAILSALAEWLAPFLVRVAAYSAGSIWAQLSFILGVGFATFAGMDTILNMFTSYVASVNNLSSYAADFWLLLGFNTALSMIVGAVTAKVAIMKAKVVLRALS